MIATGIGRNACKRGRKVLFVNAKELVDRLSDEMLAGNLQQTLDKLNRIELLIIDELSYKKWTKKERACFSRSSVNDTKKLPHYHH